jgi:hypothetical protein
MKFKNFEILRSLIAEQSRVEVLLDKLTKPSVDNDGQQKKPFLTIDEFIELIKADPTTRMNNVDINSADSDELTKIKAGKYVNWIIKQYLKTDPSDRKVFLEDLYKLTINLKKFDRFKNRIPNEFSDINKIDTKVLYQITKDFDLESGSNVERRERRERRKLDVHAGAELVFDGPTWRVIRISEKGPIGREAAQFYGGYHIETQWCTSRTDFDNFKTYIKDGPLYVIYNPNDTNVAEKTGLPVERYQFHFESNQFKDRHDVEIEDLVDYFTGKMSELKDFFKPMFFNQISKTSGNNFNIRSLSDDFYSNFIGIYGLESVFDSIPNSVEQISINDTKGKFEIDIPSNISRFKNLTALTLNGVVRSIPDSICSLSELQFLVLTSNPKLKSLPDCIIDIDTLAVINVQGCSSIVVDPRIKEEYIELDNNYFYR